jgi:hypothetical protein
MKRLGLLLLGAASGLVGSVQACASDSGDDAAPAATATSTSTGSDGGNMGAGGFSNPNEEVCDGLDNDQNDVIDDDCACSAGETQQCYPSNVPPPEGCEWGQQTCEGTSWGACTGASLPPAGEEACCTKLGDTPTHAALDAFVAAYPSANMPKTWPDIEAFMPQTGDYSIQWTQANSGNEIIDVTNGGIVAANIEAGRALARQAAEMTVPAGATIVATKEDPVIVEVLGGTAPCDGMGWGWGSFLYQASDDAVFEIVYLYIGYCAAGPPSGDIEAYYYSYSPVEVCKAPQIPR